MARILYIVAQGEPLLCGYLKAKVEARSPEGYPVEIKLDERRSERRLQSREHVPERRRADRRRRPSLYDELVSRGFTKIEVENEEEGESPPRQPAIERDAGWRPRSTRLQRTARSLRRHRAQWVVRGVALLIVVGVLLVAVRFMGRTAPRAVNSPRAVAPSTVPSGMGVSETGTAAVSPPARPTQTPRATPATPSPPSPALSQEAAAPATLGRASGVVVAVDPSARTLVMEDMGAKVAEVRRLRIRLAPDARVLLSERDPATADTRHPFTDRAINLSDIRPGDFVVVDTREQRGQALARSVTVTLQAGRGSAR